MQIEKARKRKREWLVAGLGVLVLLFVVVPGQAREAPEPAHGGTLTLGVELPIRGFDAIKARFLIRGGRTVVDLVEDPLFLRDEKGELVPHLGLKAEVSEDGKTWTVPLREGVEFHDGTPFNADAVVHHWRRLLDPEKRFYRRDLLRPVKSVEKVDDFTVRFHLLHPWTPFRSILSGEGGLVSHIPSPKAVEEGDQNERPVGTGPFLFKEWKRGDRIVVERNPGYWKKGQPYLDRVVVRVLPDHQSRFAALKAGEADLITTDMGVHIREAQSHSSLSVLESDANGAEIIYFNMGKPPLDDERVRQAIAHAHDQPMHLELVYEGTVPFARHPFGRALGCGDTGYREHDPEKARALLAEYGQPVELELMHTNTSRGRKTGEIFRQNMKEAGISVKPVGVEPTMMIQRVFMDNYQASTWRIPDMDYVSLYLRMVLHSRSPRNRIHYSSSKMDALLQEIATTTEPSRRGELRCEMARRINEDLPFIYRSGSRFHVLFRPQVRGIMGVRNGAPRLREAWLE